MQIHYAFDNGQSQTGARHRGCARRVNAIKTIEQSRQMFRGNAGTVVFDQDFDDVTLRINLDTYAPARRGVFQGVRNDITDRAPEKGAVRKKLGITEEAEFDFQFCRLQLVIGK